MSLSEIRVPAAKDNPINTFYINTLEVANVTIDELDVTGNVIVGGTAEVMGGVITNSVRSEPGNNLTLLPGTIPGNVVSITQPRLVSTNIVPNGALYLSGSDVYSSALTNGRLLIGSTGAPPVAAAISAGQGISVTNGAGSITMSRLPLVAITSITTTSIGSGAFAPLDFKNENTIYDPYGFKSSNFQFTVPLAFSGVYWIDVGCRFADSKLGTSRGISVGLNAAAIDPMGWFTADLVGLGRNSGTLSFAITLPGGAVVTVLGWQDTGGALDVTSCQLSLTCLSLGP